MAKKNAGRDQFSYEFATHFKTLVDEIASVKQVPLKEVFTFLNDAMNHLLNLRPITHAKKGWSPETIRFYTIVGRHFGIVPQQFMDTFTATYYQTVKKVNYQEIISWYACNGLSINENEIDMLGKAVSDDKSYRKSFFYSGSIKPVDIELLTKKYNEKIVMEAYNQLVDSGLSKEEIEFLKNEDVSDTKPLKEYEIFQCQQDLPISSQIFGIRLKEKVFDQNRFMLLLKGQNSTMHLAYYAIIYALTCQNDDLSLYLFPNYPMIGSDGVFVPYCPIDNFKSQILHLLPELNPSEISEFAYFINSRLKDGKAAIMFWEKVPFKTWPLAMYEFHPWPKLILCCSPMDS